MSVFSKDSDLWLKRFLLRRNSVISTKEKSLCERYNNSRKFHKNLKGLKLNFVGNLNDIIMTTTESITALNTLIEINNDRVEGYKTAMKETKEEDLRRTFVELIATSEKNLSELIKEVYSLGGTPEEGTMHSGKAFRVWMDAKAALTGGDRHQILSSCEFGEDAALKTYEEVMAHVSDLTPAEVEMVRGQQTRLRADHDRVKAMRDAD
jgi:uncharacterized protein (TIGR02284 family)